jgi:hypothetical protein
MNKSSTGIRQMPKQNLRQKKPKKNRKKMTAKLDLTHFDRMP